MDIIRPMRLLMLVLALTLTLGLAGCGDPRDVTLAKPGEYRGKQDPLLAQAAFDERTEQLRARFKHQMDR